MLLAATLVAWIERREASVCGKVAAKNIFL